MTCRIKPSAEYLQQKLEVIGRVNRTVQLVNDPPDASPGNFRFIELQGRDRKTYYAFGPGLEIEVDANRLGPFLVSPFVAGRAFYFYGDLDVKLSDENEFGESAQWKFQQDQWQWDGHIGVRLRWDPK